MIWKIERYKDNNVNLLSFYLNNFPLFLSHQIQEKGNLSMRSTCKISYKKIDYFLILGI